MRLITIVSLCAACGSSSSSKKPDAAPPADIGFNKPTMALQANNDETLVGPADLSCLGTPSSDMATTAAITLNTVVKDFQTHDLVGGAMVTAFANIDYMTTFATQTADEMGNATVTVPLGTKRFGFEMTGTAAGVLPTFLLNQYLTDPTTMIEPPGSDTDATKRMAIQSVSNSTATLLPALIGESRTMGTGVLAGALRDCQTHEISNFIATVSSTQGTATPIAGAESYYFSPGVDLPAHHNQEDSSSPNGLFMVIQLPPTATAYVQMWGYETAADVTADNLKLISELQVPVLADTVITGSYEPLRQ